MTLLIIVITLVTILALLGWMRLDPDGNPLVPLLCCLSFWLIVVGTVKPDMVPPAAVPYFQR
jgi:hypothetical protein